MRRRRRRRRGGGLWSYGVIVPAMQEALATFSTPLLALAACLPVCPCPTPPLPPTPPLCLVQPLTTLRILDVIGIEEAAAAAGGEEPELEEAGEPEVHAAPEQVATAAH